MPIYPWVDKNTGHQVEVIRHFNDYQLPPSEDELPEDEKGKERDWERLIGKLGYVSMWPTSGGPGKGNWSKQ